MRAQEFISERKTISFQGIDMSLEREEDEIMVTASAGGRPLGSVLFIDYDGALMPQDLEVDERYRGQGIAAAMYDYVKSQGYKIRRSGQQTDAGAGFWAKHRPDSNVWEQGVQEGLDPYRLERLDPQTRRVLTRMADHKDPGSWLSASEAYAMSLGLQYKNRDPRGWEQDVQRYVDLYRQYSGQGISEVVKMPPTKNSSQGMADWAYQDAQDKKAPLKDSLKGIPTEVYDMGDHLRVFVKDDQGPVLYLALNKFLDGFKSGAVAVEPRGRGKNLAVRVYQAASDTFGRPIYSDTTQTDASRIGIWQKLMTSLPGRVVGYDQRTQEDLPLTATDQGPAVRGNQPVYTQRTAKDLAKPVTGQNRSRTRLLKLLPNQQGVQEVKILSKVKGKGSEPSQLPRFGRPIGPGEETRYLGTKVADWQGREIWRDYLGGQLSYHLFDPDTRTVIVTTFGSRYKNNPRSYIIHGLYAAPGNPVGAAEFYRGLVRDLGLTLISDRKQSPGGNRVWQQLEQFPDVEVYGYDTNTDQALNFGAGDVEMYTVPSAAVAGSREMQQVARDLRLVATAR
jgi:hypothetical protein